MALSTDFKRALLRTIYDELADSGRTLTQALADLRKARVDETKGGSVIVSTAANGHAVTLDVVRCTQMDIAAVASQFEDLYAKATTTLAAADNDSPTDAQYLAEMLTFPELKGYRSYRTDFSLYGEDARSA